MDQTPPQLAIVANREHALARESRDSAVEHAWRAGQALLRAKSQLSHGQWLPWLAANFEGTVRTAQRYVRIAAKTTRVSHLDTKSQRQALAALTDGPGAHLANNSGDFEWYTAEVYVKPATVVMGGIDLDPASSPEANKTVGATIFYRAEDNSLGQNWRGRVWMNPPYAQPLIGQFTAKLAESYTAKEVTQACVLVNNATETTWFQELAGVGSAICFLRGRVRFWHPEKESVSPLQGQAVIYLGDNVKRFRAEYARFGFTVTP
jgi:phage N-6-adenine-methyltransferase